MSTRNFMLYMDMISVPVRLETMVEKPDTSFHQGHKCGDKLTRLNQRLFCADCETIVDYDDVLKVREDDQGQLIAFDQSQVADMREKAMVSEAKQAVISVVSNATSLMRPTGTAYYAYPEPNASMQAYSALVSLVSRHPEWQFVTVFSTRKGSENMGRVVVVNDILALECCAWPELVRATEEIDVQSDPRADAMMDRLASEMVQDFDPDQYQNQFATALATAVADYDGKLPAAPKATKAAQPKVDPFMDMLKSAVDKRTKKKRTPKK